MPGSVQLEYIAMPLGRALIPYLTPQTLLVGVHAKLVWFRAGAMDEQALRGGLAAMRKVSDTR
jgi:hypothetical protein